MKNVKKIGIIVAVLVVVIVIAVVFRDQWANILNSFLSWIQQRLGMSSSQVWTMNISSGSMY